MWLLWGISSGEETISLRSLQIGTVSINLPKTLREEGCKLIFHFFQVLRMSSDDPISAHILSVILI